ncbi:DUF7507 domain-containing protein [Corynebacterium aquilae]|uniref:DUF7507 domain-containing protein n=1 Tax=Corynebacterium aquilae DSM 44791 TaxID=1431546 RepID=A0A1L7CHZ0_9CORY|nr:DUF11 domain-containing protein [Corynebacterium aquilae]APT85477.1 hypothetical protein CAQU_10915 [Corynebacterium aquilae DSM 44791]
MLKTSPIRDFATRVVALLGSLFVVIAMVSQPAVSHAQPAVHQDAAQQPALLAQVAAGDDAAEDDGVVMEPQAFDPDRSIEYSDGEVFVRMTIDFEGAGRGQNPANSKNRPCVVTKDMGYPIGDESPDDNNMCAGDGVGALYNVGFSYRTGKEPVTMTIMPQWTDVEPIEGMGTPQMEPSIVYQLTNSNTVSYVRNKDGSYTFTFAPSPGVTKSIGWKAMVSTVEPRRKNQATQNQAGSWRMGAEVFVGRDTSGKEVGIAKADQDLNVLAVNRMDQRIDQLLVDSNFTYFDRPAPKVDLDPNSDRECVADDAPKDPAEKSEEYIGISAVSNLTKSWDQTYASVIPGKYDKTIGIDNGVSQSTMTRFMLEKPADMPDADMKKIRATYEGQDVEVKFDDAGNAYFDRHYTTSTGQSGSQARFKFFVPVSSYQDGTYKWNVRMDTVDEQGADSRVMTADDLGMYIPRLAGNAADGNNTTDPGNGQACSVATTNNDEGIVGGKGLPNNNCALANVVIKHYQCDENPEADGCQDFRKDDRILSRSATFSPSMAINGGKEPVNSSEVKLSVSPGSDVTMCVGWAQGTQRMSDGKLYINGWRAQELQSIFPDAKIYYTNSSFVNQGNADAPIDCKGADWTLAYDSSKNLNTDPANVFEGGINEVTGFYVAFPGDGAISAPTTLAYRVSSIDATKSRELFDGKHPGYNIIQDTAGEDYMETFNYMKVQSGCAAPQLRKSRIMFSRPEAGVSTQSISAQGNTLDSKTSQATELGPSHHSFKLVPTINWNNGNDFINGVSSNGEKTRIHNRLYFSKCLEPDTDVLPPNAVIHADPSTKSDNPLDCGYDKDRYIETTWALSTESSNDPLVPRWPALKKPDVLTSGTWSKNAGNAADWGYQPTFGFVTPGWTGPKSQFNIMSEWRLTGTPAITDPNAPGAGPVDSRAPQPRPSDPPNSPQVVAGPDNIDPWPNNYKPLNSSIGTMRIWVPEVSSGALSKTENDKLIPVNNTFSHSLALASTDRSADSMLGATEFIDVLPYPEDGRGSDYSGQYWLSQMPTVVPAGFFDVYYTTAPPETVSMCPNGIAPDAQAAICSPDLINRDDQRAPNIDRQPSNTDWKPLTPQIVAELAKNQGKGEKITALKFTSKNFPGGAYNAAVLTFATRGNHADDVYANSAGPVSVQGVAGRPVAPVPATQVVKTRVYAGEISGRVYVDANESGDYENGEAPGSPRNVVLLSCSNDTGELVCNETEPVQTLELPANGEYLFKNLPAGIYKVVVRHNDNTEINTESGKNPANVGKWESDPLQIYGISPERNGGNPERISDIDFGYYNADPKLSIEKSVDNPDTPREVDGKAVFTIEGANTGNVPLNQVKLTDNWVKGELTFQCTIMNSDGVAYEGEELKAKGDLLSEEGANLARGDKYRCISEPLADGTITQADIDKQEDLLNKASITGRYLENPPIDPQKSEAKVPLKPAEPHLTLTKLVEGEASKQKAAGETATFDFTVTNDGNVTMNKVNIADNFGDRKFVSAIACDDLDGAPFVLGQSALAPKQAATCHADYVVTQADVDAQREIPNTAKPTGEYYTPADPRTVYEGDEAKATITVPDGTPDVSLVKQVRNVDVVDDQFDNNKEVAAKQNAEFLITIVNNSAVTITEANLEDVMDQDKGAQITSCFDSQDPPKAVALNGSRNLAPQERITCTVRYQMTTADQDAQKKITNTATLTGKVVDPKNPDATMPVREEDDATIQPPAAAPSVLVNKTVGDSRNTATLSTLPRDLNQNAFFKIEFTNTGNVTLRDVQLVDTWDKDPQLDLSCDGGWKPGQDLAAGTTMTCYATYQVTQDDIDAGKELFNKVHITAKATGPDGEETTVENIQPDPQASVTVPQLDGAISIDKRVDAKQEVNDKRVGDKVAYTIRVTNESNMRQYNVKLDDEFRGIDFTCSGKDGASFKLDGTETLQVGESVLCEGEYTLTQDDIDNGKPFTNEATVTGHPGKPDAEPQIRKDSATVTPLAGVPSITVFKRTRDASEPVNRDEEKQSRDVVADQAMQFDFWFRNNGSSTLHNVNVTDIFDYNSEAKDSFRGAEGTPALECYKGEDKIQLGNLDMAPGDEIRCQLAEPYTVTQADVNLGRDIVNNVTVTGTSKVDPQDPENVNVEGSGDATLHMPPAAPQIELTKVVGDGPEQRKVLKPGEATHFTITVQNTGNVTLTDVKIDDQFAQVYDLNKAPLDIVECVKQSDQSKVDPKAGFVLEPKDSAICKTAEYTVTPDDMQDQRPLPNKAVVTSVFQKSGGTKITPTDDDTAVINVPPASPQMTVDKAVAPTFDGKYKNTVKRNGNEVAYFRINGGNTGNVTLENALLTDEWAKDEALTFQCHTNDIGDVKGADFEMGTGPGVLLPGQTFVCDGEYPVTQDDQDAQQSLRNYVKLTADYTNGWGDTTKLTQDADATVVMRDPRPALTLNKTVDGEKAVTRAAGDGVTWTITGANTGNVTLKDVTIGDTYPKGKDAPEFTCETSAGTKFTFDEGFTLKPKETYTCTGVADGFITMEDVINGEDKVNEATANFKYTDDEGEEAEGDELTSSAKVTPLRAEPAFELNKTVDYTAGDKATENKSVTLGKDDVAYFTIVGRNTGNVPLTDVDLDDNWAAGNKDKLKLECGEWKIGDDLAPGEQFVCTADYTVNQADVDAGETLVNEVTMTPKFGKDKLEPKKSEATVEVPAPSSEIRLDKRLAKDEVRKETYVPGETVRYEFDVTNVGNVTLHGTKIADPTLAERGIQVTCDPDVIEPGKTITCTADKPVELTEEDAAKGKLVNTAIARAMRPNQNDSTGEEFLPTSNPDTETVTVGIPKLGIDKTAENTSPVLVNGEVLWKIKVINPSPFTLTEVYIDDDQVAVADSVECHAGTTKQGEKLKGRTEVDGKTVAYLGTMIPDEVATCWLSVPLDKAPEPDNDGNIVNVAAVMGLFGDEPIYAEDNAPTDTAKVPVGTQDALVLEKTVKDPEKVYKEGEKATYVFKLTNVGGADLVNVKVNDPNFGEAPFECGDTTLLVGKSTTCEREYTVTENNAKAGTVTNVATADSQTRYGKNVPSNAARATIKTATNNPGLKLTKVISNGGEDKIFEAGQTVKYTFTIVNNGDVPLTGVMLNDPMFGEPSECGTKELAEKQQTTCVREHVVTDEEAASPTRIVRNTAVSTGLDPQNREVKSNEDTAIFTIPAPKPSSLQLTKESNGEEFKVGEYVEYTLKVTNTGETQLNNVTVTDPMFGTEPFVCGTNTLVKSGSTQCTKLHKVTPEDQASGTIVNTAEANGTSPNGTAVTPSKAFKVVKVTPAPVPAPTPVPTPTNPGISLDKKITNGESFDEGQTVTYEFTVTNTGDVDLKGIKVADKMFGDEPFDCGPADAVLPKTESVNCTKDHVVTAADAEAKTVTNVATATGTAGEGDDAKTVTSNPGTAVFKVPAAPQPEPTKPTIELAKKITNGDTFKVGETVTYEFTVTNTGDVDLKGIKVADKMFGDEPFDCGPADAVLPKTESVTCTKDHVVTAADAEAKTVTNVATATGTAGEGDDAKTVTSNPGTAVFKVPAETPAPTPAPVPTKPSLDLTKSITNGGKDKEFQVGQTVTYKLEVTNTGDVALTNVKVSDKMFGDEPFVCGLEELEPKGVTTCTKDHVVTAADAKAVTVVNIAQAAGNDPTGYQVLSPQANDKFTVPVKPVPAISLKKSITNGGEDKRFEEGDVVNYSFEVTNTGATKLSDIAIDDDMIIGAITCEDTELEPNISTTCTATHIVSPDDAEKQTVINVATAKAKDEYGVPVESAPDKAAFTVPAKPAPQPTPTNPAIALEKTITNGDTFEEGQNVTYSFKVTNTGDVELHNVKISDKMFGDEPFTCGEQNLAPKASTTCTKDHVVTKADAEAKTVTNVATATGTTGEDADSPAVTSNPAQAVFKVPAETPAPTPGQPAISLEKKITNGASFDEGATVTYELKVTNTGDVALKDVKVADKMFGDEPFVCGDSALEPKASTTCTKDHVVTKADAEAKTVTNVATATGADEAGKTVTSQPGTATFTVPAKPEPKPEPKPEAGAIALEKAITNGDADKTFAVGADVEYLLKVTNTSTVKVTDVRVIDPMFGDKPFVCGETTLEPGASTECTKTHKVTEADARAVTVTNTAGAQAKEANGTAIKSNPAVAKFQVPTAPADKPALGLSKAVDNAGPAKAGEKVVYTFTVTNTGNTELTGVEINDPMLAQAGVTVTCEATTLPVGASTTCTSGEYTITEADAARGVVVNKATATGTSTGGEKVTSNEDDATVTTARTPAGSVEGNIPWWSLIPLTIPLIIGGGSSDAPAPGAQQPVPAQPAPAPDAPQAPNAPQAPGVTQQPQRPTPAQETPSKGIPRTIKEVRSLANTGASVYGIVAGGALLITAGALLVGAARRRREEG